MLVCLFEFDPQDWIQILKQAKNELYKWNTTPNFFTVLR